MVYVERGADHYEELPGFVRSSAKTAIVVPDLNGYYLAAPRHNDQIAGVKVYEAQ
jgi:hypothetical protein